MEDCELDRVGLPGLMVKVGAGDGCDGGGMIGEALVREGDAVAVGVGTGVEFADDVGKAMDVETTGW